METDTGTAGQSCRPLQVGRGGGKSLGYSGLPPALGFGSLLARDSVCTHNLTVGNTSMLQVLKLQNSLLTPWKDGRGGYTLSASILIGLGLTLPGDWTGYPTHTHTQLRTQVPCF